MSLFGGTVIEESKVERIQEKGRKKEPEIPKKRSASERFLPYSEPFSTKSLLVRRLLGRQKSESIREIMYMPFFQNIQIGKRDTGENSELKTHPLFDCSHSDSESELSESSLFASSLPELFPSEFRRFLFRIFRFAFFTTLWRRPNRLRPPPGDSSLSLETQKGNHQVTVGTQNNFSRN